MKISAVLAALLLFVPAASDAAGERAFPEPQYGETLVVPATSPVRFKAFRQPLDAAFTGQFVLTGVFTYGCEFDCEGPVRPADLMLYFIPDPSLAARFPHWTKTHNDVRVAISGAEPFLRRAITSKQRAALASGKLPLVTGRAGILITDFHTSVECGTVFWTARFVAVARPVKLKSIRVAGNFGCG
jgi:hypothetical protein